MNIGDRVRVRSQRDINNTLDADHECDDIYCDSEMFDYCGMEFRVQHTDPRGVISLVDIEGQQTGVYQWVWMIQWLETPIPAIQFDEDLFIL